MRAGDPESVLVQHQEECHPNKEPEYAMKMVKTHRRPLYRQIHESILNDRFKGHTILNRKGEWGSNVPAKLGMGDEDPGQNPPGGKNQGKLGQIMPRKGEGAIRRSVHQGGIPQVQEGRRLDRRIRKVKNLGVWRNQRKTSRS